MYDLGLMPHNNSTIRQFILKSYQLLFASYHNALRVIIVDLGYLILKKIKGLRISIIFNWSLDQNHGIFYYFQEINIDYN